MQILKDLQGNPYKFYRGKDCEYISNGCFFCSCFDIAKSYRLYEETPIIETEIAVHNPLIIDATVQGGHSAYGYLHVIECKLYPENKRGALIKHIKKVGGTDTLSTDEILEWARKTIDIDAVVIKSVREGINAELPIYDVMVWNKKNLVNTRNVVNNEHEFELFRANTFKRVDLSAYITENERDGIVSVTQGTDYYVEHKIQRVNTDWYMEHELVVASEVPIRIFCIDTENYLKAERLEPGVYENMWWITSERVFVPHEGLVRVKGMLQNCKYQIEYV